VQNFIFFISTNFHIFDATRIKTVLNPKKKKDRFTENT